MVNREHGLGGKPHKPDERDWMMPRVAAIGDRQLWGMHGKGFRIDQGSEGTCVGHASTNALLAEPRPHNAFDPFRTVPSAHQFARDLYLEGSGDSTYQQGMYVRDAMDVMVKRGYGNYYRCTGVPDTLQGLDTGPIVFASPWYYSMFTPHEQRGGYLTVNPDSELAGFHCYLLTGKDLSPDDGSPPFVRMQNSWGTEWGMDGCARIKVEDLNILYDGDSFLFTEVRF